MKKLNYKLLLFLVTLITIAGTSSMAQIINTFAGNGTAGYSGDGGPAASANLNAPNEVVADNAGNIYFADRNNNAVRMVNTSGIISTFAGTGVAGTSGDGGPATSAQINGPLGLAIDAAGNIYIGENSGHRVRKVNTSGIISTFAGSTQGFSGDGGPAASAQINSPTGLGIDPSGNVYITDGNNQRIRKVDINTGIISTYAGNGSNGSGGDGGAATSANLANPYDIGFDASGNGYIADAFNHRVRKVDISGIISTFFYAGFGHLYPVCAEYYGGDMYFSFLNFSRVFKINSAGSATVYAGTNTNGYLGDGGSSTSARLNNPRGLAFDAAGNLYIGDASNNRIRIVMQCLVASVPTISASVNPFCTGGTGSTTLSITSGSLNNSTAWQWYSGSCGGTSVGSGTSISVSPSTTTTYYARGEGGCATAGSCGSVTITVNTPSAWYLDSDNDGHYTSSTQACSNPGTGYNQTATQNGDCDDNDNSKWQSASLFIDNDGDGYDNGSTTVCYGAAIPSGYIMSSAGADCDDNSGTINPAATEILCNNIDENCNGMADDGVQSAAPVSAVSDAIVNEICLGGSANLTVNGGSLGTGAVWEWLSGSCNGTSVGTGNTISVSPTSATTYFVKSTGACGNPSCAQVTITIKTAPPTSNVVVPPIVNLPGTACSGIVASNINIPVVPTASYYIWDGPAGTTFNGSGNPYHSSTPSANISFGVPGGSGYYIGVQAANACGTTLRKVQWVRGIVGVPAAVIPGVSGLTTYCANSSASFSCEPVTGATGYQWSVTGDATITPSGNSVTVNFGPSWSTGMLCVAAQTSCYTSAAKCLQLGTSTAAAYSPQGTFTACPGQTLTYSVPASPNVSSYSWTIPGNSNGNSTGSSINVSFLAGFTNGDICVTATSSCGVVMPQKCKSITTGAATTPASITGPANGLCGQTVSYNCPPQAGVSFNWTFPSGASPSTISNGNNSVSTDMPGAPFTTGQVCVTAQNGCGSSTQRCITVKGSPNTPGAITANPAVWCNNEPGISFNSSLANLAGAYSLAWNVIPESAATYVLGQGSNSYTVDWNTGNASVNLTASNACGTATRTYPVAIGCREASPSTNDITIDDRVRVIVYPNPAHNIVYIETGDKNFSSLNIQLKDITGKIVLDKNLSGEAMQSSASVDVSNLDKGVYLLELSADSYHQLQKLVIQ